MEPLPVRESATRKEGCACSKKKERVEEPPPPIESDDSCPCSKRMAPPKEETCCPCSKKNDEEDNCPCGKKEEKVESKGEGDGDDEFDEENEEPEKDEDVPCYCTPSEKERQKMVVELEEKLERAKLEIDALQEEMRKLQRMDPNRKIGPNGGPSPAALYKEIMRGTKENAQGGNTCPGPKGCGLPQGYRIGGQPYDQKLRRQSKDVFNAAYVDYSSQGTQNTMECSQKSPRPIRPSTDALNNGFLDYPTQNLQKRSGISPQSTAGFQASRTQQRYEKPFGTGLPFDFPCLSPCPYRKPPRPTPAAIKETYRRPKSSGGNSGSDSSNCSC